jgi:DNA-binding transcriptional MerR regulator
MKTLETYLDDSRNYTVGNNSLPVYEDEDGHSLISIRHLKELGFRESKIRAYLKVEQVLIKDEVVKLQDLRSIMDLREPTIKDALQSVLGEQE